MNRVMPIFYVITGILVTMPATIWAQSHSVSPGDTLRVTYTDVVSSQTVGVLKYISADSIHLNKKDTTLSLPLSTVKRVDKSIGRRTWEGRGTAIGAISGGLLLGILMVASEGSSGSSSDAGGFGNIELLSSGEVFAAGFVVGAAGGAFAGLIIGGLTESHRWEMVPLDLGVEPISFRLVKSLNNYGFTVRWSF